MKKVIKELKKHNYDYVYMSLKEKKYEYTLDNLATDFSSVTSINKYCYLIYLLSKENTPQHIILICEFLIYTDTFFFDIYPVIYMFITQSLQIFSSNKFLLKWVIQNYENHPDSPFSKDEMSKYKILLGTE